MINNISYSILLLVLDGKKKLCIYKGKFEINLWRNIFWHAFVLIIGHWRFVFYWLKSIYEQRVIREYISRTNDQNLRQGFCNSKYINTSCQQCSLFLFKISTKLTRNILLQTFDLEIIQWDMVCHISKIKNSHKLAPIY